MAQGGGHGRHARRAARGMRHTNAHTPLALALGAVTATVTVTVLWSKSRSDACSIAFRVQWHAVQSVCAVCTRREARTRTPRWVHTLHAPRSRSGPMSWRGG